MLLTCLLHRFADSVLASDLAHVRQELAETAAGLRVATAENEKLWLLIERDRARIERERSIEQGARAVAELASIDDTTTERLAG